MPIPATPVEVRFAQSEQRKFSKFLLPGQVTEAQNVDQATAEGLYSKRDGYSPLATTGLPEDVEPTDLGAAGTNLAEVTTTGLHLSIDDEWEQVEPHSKTFGTYETVIESGGFRPSRLTASNGNVWHFSASQHIDATTGRQATYRVVDPSGRELVPTTTMTAGPIDGGKAVEVDGKILYVYFTFLSPSNTLAVRIFDVAAPTAAPDLLFPDPVTGTIFGFDVRETPGDDPIVMFWGEDLDGSGAAVGVARLPSTGALGPVTYSNFADDEEAKRVGGLFRGEGARTVGLTQAGEYLGVVSHDGAPNDSLDLVVIDPVTLACTFTVLTNNDLSGVHQAGGTVGPDGSYHVFHSDCRELMDASTTMPPPRPQLWRLVHDPAGPTTTVDRLAYGAWLAADPVALADQVLLILGHESRFSAAGDVQLAPQRCYSLMDAATGRTLGRTMYEAGGGDCDHRAGSGLLAQGGFLPPVEVVADTLVADLSACDDGLTNFSVAEVTWALAATISPPVQIDDALFVPGAYPRWLGKWGRALDAAPQFFPEHVAVAAVESSGFVEFAGTFRVCATYVLVTPDGDEVESQPSADVEVEVSLGERIQVVVPRLVQFAGTDAAAKCFVRVYSTTPASDTFFRQLTVPNDATTDTLTITLPGAPVVGPTLYTEGGAPENVPCPPCRVATYWDQRLFVSGTAEKGLVYPSNLITAGQLPAFIDDGKFSVGPTEVRAMCPVDKNYLAIFHDGGISVVSRGGHTRGGTDPYVAVPVPGVMTTTNNPRSVVTTDKGCVFQGEDGGVYLLGRDLQVTFIGRGVDAHRAETVTSAAYLPKVQHVRLTTAANVLVFDMRNRPAVPVTAEDTLGQWYVWPLDTAGMVAGIVHNGAHHVLAADGAVWSQVEGQAFDGADTFIPMRLVLPLSFQGIVAYLRCLRGLLLTQWVGPHVLQLTVDTDGTATPLAPKVLDTAKKRPDFRPSPSKASHFVLTVQEVQHEGALNKGFRLEGLGFEVQRQPGLARGDARAGS